MVNEEKARRNERPVMGFTVVHSPPYSPQWQSQRRGGWTTAQPHCSGNEEPIVGKI
jgi:hypothetical protein